MKTFRFIIPVILLILSASSAYAQDSRTERKARRIERREARRIERMVLDSLRMSLMEGDSVNIGYGYVKKKNLTTSVSKVSVRQRDINGYTSIGEYLRGRVPGLMVTKVGGSYKYSIRGVNSINSSTDPLFVVDGAVVMDIDYLNPSDIQSVEVLKDSSTSIYGTRGACGVIIITTRRTLD